MLHRVMLVKRPVRLGSRERRACFRIGCYVLVQCAAVLVGCCSVYWCAWKPTRAEHDYDKLARVMYLYDAEACACRVHSGLAIANLRLSNNTRGRAVLPVRWRPAVVTVTASFAAATRYLNFSVAVHLLWAAVSALLAACGGRALGGRAQRFALASFLYVSAGVLAFDVSMAIVYVSHIKKSLTKGMILRYSGWSVEMQLHNYSDFGGWVPMAAALCWLRGGAVLLNAYCCRVVRRARKALRGQELRRRLTLIENRPLPDASSSAPRDPAALYYRAGERAPSPGTPPRLEP